MKSLLVLIFSISFSIFAQENEICAECYSGFTQPKGTICVGWEFRIEPDMQITDNDLSLESAKDSLTWLSNNLEKQGFLFEYGKANRIKVLQGYTLKAGYLNAHPNDKDNALINYCNWLKTEGVWYD
ncbi:MAG: hypothetical protein ACI9VT_003857 [Psychroserpens sp.]|jgi:hypothetical protein